MLDLLFSILKTMLCDRSLMVFGCWAARFRDGDGLLRTVSKKDSVFGRACTRLGLSTFESSHRAVD